MRHEDPEFSEDVGLHGIRMALIRYAYKKGVILGSALLSLEKLERIVDILDEP